MMVYVVDDDRKGIQATLRSYDELGALIGDETISDHGTDVQEIPGAVWFRFIAEGFQDAVIDDLYEYGSLTMEMIPRYRWVLPAAIAGFAVLLLSKVIKI